ncbi:hypothetical protein C8R46DRAFT_1067806 [Mycena filopes]|nr:hypothetical protein C8R46DRAFT_1067806 [Mycena filopes]
MDINSALLLQIAAVLRSNSLPQSVRVDYSSPSPANPRAHCAHYTLYANQTAIGSIVVDPLVSGNADPVSWQSILNLLADTLERACFMQWYLTQEVRDVPNAEGSVVVSIERIFARPLPGSAPSNSANLSNIEVRERTVKIMRTCGRRCGNLVPLFGPDCCPVHAS